MVSNEYEKKLVMDMLHSAMSDLICDRVSPTELRNWIHGKAELPEPTEDYGFLSSASQGWKLEESKQVLDLKPILFGILLLTISFIGSFVFTGFWVFFAFLSGASGSLIYSEIVRVYGLRTVLYLTACVIVGIGFVISAFVFLPYVITRLKDMPWEGLIIAIPFIINVISSIRERIYENLCDK